MFGCPALPDAPVRLGQLDAQRGVGRRIVAEPLEIRQCLGHNRLPDRRRSGERPHLVVDLEDQRVGELPRIVEPRAVPDHARRIGHTRLPERHAKRGSSAAIETPPATNAARWRRAS